MILVLVETDPQGVTLTSREALTFARTMGERMGDPQLEAVAVGPLPDTAAVLAHLGEQGVTTLHHADDERLAAYGAAAWAAAVVDVASSGAARLVVGSGTPRGMEVLAHVATRLDCLMAANVIALEDTDPLTVSRQVMGGGVFERMRLDGEVAVVAVAGHAVDPVPAAESRTTDVRTYEPALTDADLLTRVVRTEKAAGEDTSALTGAKVVVGAGRGAGSADGFTDLLELKDLLGGALGVSRVVTSLGWRPHHEQVGQTGSRISPDLYVACGISGAIQHWAGCQSAKTILAINTDPDAPMVTQAHYAVIGDLHEVVPAINEELRRRRG
ncbi:electron transfer flavoprotein subunit alpha/FixB family protein [Aeromicrobium chenweiae]|uniref:Electron transfer flavoprotein subunit alpha/FixB family protein n=1 Tax=Aeromicrobium chenweiae TaxID=2079793 RepID=A0A2S0WJJ7_9ACTN|nr:electron transfer flavoprotein subunit alpha/FixB family protein [Aeromicrobium chenweiae]AWB91467.1 electron transfer flavoprotein subunit alpha/FixB family protein [Aeromicrobium chenweiae]TGN29951.1 electron transfer flavoprotein subunit alpha/FixB family protein [Aeromicrobium chenweiae]